MRRAVIDTNILISGLLGGSTARALIDAFIDRKFKLVTSYAMLKELFEVLNRPKFRGLLPEEDVDEFAFLLELEARIVEPRVKVRDCRDPKDNIVLECALESKPDFVISGDNDLLILSPYRGIPIITLSRFLEKLEYRANR